MSKAVFNLSPLELSQHYLEILLEQLTTDYQQAHSERLDFSAYNEASSHEFTSLEEIELLTVQLRGYAHQIQARGQILQPNEAILHLHSLHPFSLPSLAQFYWQTEGQYPLLKTYLQKLDYLRLLILDYLTAQTKA